MEVLRRMPMWAWVAAGIAVAIALAVSAIFIVRTSGPRLPPGLAEKRAEAAKILDELGRIEDVDLRPLTELEAKKNYQGAAALVGQALAVNDRQEALNAALVSTSEELARLAVGVHPDEVGTKAVEAFSILVKLAEAERKYFTDRKLFYRLARDYYAAFASGEKPLAPKDFASLADAVEADFARVRDLHRNFTAAVRVFDEVVRK